jgi:hypothetical protein
MLVKFCHDRDLDFAQFDQQQMLVVQAKAMEGGVEILAAYMYRPLVVVGVEVV